MNGLRSPTLIDGPTPDTGNLSVIPMDRFRTDTRVSPMTSRDFQHITFHKIPCRQRLLPVLAAWSCAEFPRVQSTTENPDQSDPDRSDDRAPPFPSHHAMPERRHRHAYSDKEPCPY